MWGFSCQPACALLQKVLIKFSGYLKRSHFIRENSKQHQMIIADSQKNHVGKVTSLNVQDMSVFPIAKSVEPPFYIFFDCDGHTAAANWKVHSFHQPIAKFYDLLAAEIWSHRFGPLLDS